MITMTREIAYAIGMDAGNRSMHNGGRTVWNVDDYNASVDAFNKAWPDELADDGDIEP
jgi:hypothetical protein